MDMHTGPRIAGTYFCRIKTLGRRPRPQKPPPRNAAGNSQNDECSNPPLLERRTLTDTFFFASFLLSFHHSSFFFWHGFVIHRNILDLYESNYIHLFLL